MVVLVGFQTVHNLLPNTSYEINCCEINSLRTNPTRSTPATSTSVSSTPTEIVESFVQKKAALAFHFVGADLLGVNEDKGGTLCFIPSQEIHHDYKVRLLGLLL